MSHPQDDQRCEVLLISAAGGSVSAFAELYDETAPHAYLLARERLGDGRAAEDATQAAYLEVWRSAPGYRGDGHAIEWVLDTVARALAPAASAD